MTHSTPPRRAIYGMDGYGSMRLLSTSVRLPRHHRRRVTLSGRSYSMGPMAFRVLIIGGTGQVGAAVVRALAAEPSCVEVVMVNRERFLSRQILIRQVTMDTAADHFVADVTTRTAWWLARPGLWCIVCGRRQGRLNWSEDESARTWRRRWLCPRLSRGGIERFALLSAVGSSSTSRIRYVRIMGLKDHSRNRLQTPGDFPAGHHRGQCPHAGLLAWPGRLIPSRFGTVEQNDIGRAFVSEFISSPVPDGIVYFENGAMRAKSRASIAG